MPCLLHRLTLEVPHCGLPSRMIIDPAIPRKGHKPLELAEPLHSGTQPFELAEPSKQLTKSMVDFLYIA